VVAAVVVEIVEDGHQVDVTVGIGVAVGHRPEQKHPRRSRVSQGAAGAAGIVNGGGKHGLGQHHRKD